MNRLDTLTKQECYVLALVAKGWRNSKIALELVISVRTVETHIYHIFDKLEVTSRTEAALYALTISNSEISGISDDTVATTT